METEIEIEKNIKGFFRKLLKEKVDQPTNQSIGGSQGIHGKTRDKIVVLKSQVSELCGEKKEDLAPFSYKLWDQIKNLEGNLDIRPIKKKGNWLWFWNK